MPVFRCDTKAADLPKIPSPPSGGERVRVRGAYFAWLVEQIQRQLHLPHRQLYHCPGEAKAEEAATRLEFVADPGPPLYCRLPVATGHRFP